MFHVSTGGLAERCKTIFIHKGKSKKYAAALGKIKCMLFDKAFVR